MRIEILYFAQAREAAGRPAEPLDVTEGATVNELRATLCARHPRLAGLPPETRFAVGERFASESHRLEDGDVVALIPPVSGG